MHFKVYAVQQTRALGNKIDTAVAYSRQISNLRDIKMLYLYLSNMRLAEASGSSAAASSLLSVVSVLPLLLTKRKIAPPTAARVNNVDTTCSKSYLLLYTLKQCNLTEGATKGPRAASGHRGSRYNA